MGGIRRWMAVLAVLVVAGFAWKSKLDQRLGQVFEDQVADLRKYHQVDLSYDHKTLSTGPIRSELVLTNPVLKGPDASLRWEGTCALQGGFSQRELHFDLRGRGLMEWEGESLRIDGGQLVLSFPRALLEDGNNALESFKVEVRLTDLSLSQSSSQGSRSGHSRIQGLTLPSAHFVLDYAELKESASLLRLTFTHHIQSLEFHVAPELESLVASSGQNRVGKTSGRVEIRTPAKARELLMDLYAAGQNPVLAEDPRWVAAVGASMVEVLGGSSCVIEQTQDSDLTRADLCLWLGAPEDSSQGMLQFKVKNHLQVKPGFQKATQEGLRALAKLTDEQRLLLFDKTGSEADEERGQASLAWLQAMQPQFPSVAEVVPPLHALGPVDLELTVTQGISSSGLNIHKVLSVSDARLTLEELGLKVSGDHRTEQPLMGKRVPSHQGTWKLHLSHYRERLTALLDYANHLIPVARALQLSTAADLRPEDRAMALTLVDRIVTDKGPSGDNLNLPVTYRVGPDEFQIFLGERSVDEVLQIYFVLMAQRAKSNPT